MTIVATDRLRQHVHDLARAFGAVVLERADVKPEDAVAALRQRVVVVAPIHDETLYAVALHELGHLVDPMGGVFPERDASRQRAWALTLAAEEAAWAWAQHNALDWSPAMDGVRDWALSTYRKSAPPPPAQAPQHAQPITDRIDWTKWNRRTK